MKKINILCAVLAFLFMAMGGAYLYYKNINLDETPPEIRVEEETITCGIEAMEKELIRGMKATDTQSGDLTDQIMVNEIRKKHNEEAADNEFEISYVVFDNASNMAEAKRTLIYEDYQAPMFTLSEALRFDSVADANLNLLKYIGAEDCIDGNISSQIRLEMEDTFLAADSEGIYDCEVEVTNSLDDTVSLPLRFTVINSASDSETAKPVIRLNEYLIYLERGAEFNPEEYLTEVTIDVRTYKLLDKAVVKKIKDYSEADYGYYSKNYGIFISKGKIKVETDLDTEVPGIYTVKYSMKHPEKDATGTAELMVVIR